MPGPLRGQVHGGCRCWTRLPPSATSPAYASILHSQIVHDKVGKHIQKMHQSQVRPLFSLLKPSQHQHSPSLPPTPTLAIPSFHHRHPHHRAKRLRGWAAPVPTRPQEQRPAMRAKRAAGSAKDTDIHIHSSLYHLVIHFIRWREVTVESPQTPRAPVEIVALHSLS